MNLRLPDPMLTRPADLPLGPGYAFEVKWDGFRALVSTLDRLRVRSRRGWDMTERLPELASLPESLVLDGELVAVGDDGRPSFPRLSNRISLPCRYYDGLSSGPAASRTPRVS